MISLKLDCLGIYFGIIKYKNLIRIVRFIIRPDGLIDCNSLFQNPGFTNLINLVDQLLSKDLIQPDLYYSYFYTM